MTGEPESLLACAVRAWEDDGDRLSARGWFDTAYDIAERTGDWPVLAAAAARCVRHGRRWRVELGVREVVVDHAVGMLHLAVLTANPATEVAAIDLVAGVDALDGAIRRSAMPAQPVLDPAAARQYRRRVAELQDRLTGPDEAARLEHEWLVAELAANTRADGRSRNFPDNSERARSAVGRAIRRAIARIERADATIGAHFRASVHTGISCWYRPV